jgi:hypothetical protein
MPFSFNAREHDPSGAFGGQSMPIGKYPVVITGSRLEAASTNANSGRLVFDLLVIDGEHKNSAGSWGLNLFNENQQAAQIAARQLSAVCTVLNTHQLNQEPPGVELHNKPFLIEFVQQKKNPQYVECANVWDITGNMPGKNTPAPAAQTAPPAQFGQHSTPVQPAQPAQQPWQQQAAQAPAQAPPQPAANGWAPAAQPAAQPATQPWSQQPSSSQAPWQR